MARSTASSSERLARTGSSVTRVYLDYAGFSPVDPRVVALMRPFLEGGVGNPSAPHSLGLEARASLDGARAKVARLVGATPAGVVFTASATEANNLAIRGLAERARGRHVVTSAVEHISVLNACRHLAKRGWEVAYAPVDGEGRVDPDAIARAVRDDTVLVSVMAANGEIGTLQPLRDIGRAARARGVPFHVDAVGAAGRVPLAVDELGIDLLTLSSNDLYGPPGAGALWVRPEVKLSPVVVGGGQESGYRAGTENLPAIVGMGVAADLARVEGPAEIARLAAQRDRLFEGALERVPRARITGARGVTRLPHHASFVVSGVKADAVLLELDLRGVAASRRRQQHVGLIREPADPHDRAEKMNPENEQAQAHRAEPVSAASAPGTSVKSVKMWSGAHAASSSCACWPVATATATAPHARAQSTSSGVSPMIVTRSNGNSRPATRRARAHAMAGSRRRSMSSEPKAPTRNNGSSPVGASFSRAPASMLPVRRPTSASSRAASAWTTSPMPGMTCTREPSPIACRSSSA